MTESFSTGDPQDDRAAHIRRYLTADDDRYRQLMSQLERISALPPATSQPRSVADFASIVLLFGKSIEAVVENEPTSGRLEDDELAAAVVNTAKRLAGQTVVRPYGVSRH